MNQLAKNLCCEWGPDGITVNAVAPWYILTPLTKPVLENKDYNDKVLARTPLKRVGEPSEVSGQLHAKSILLCHFIFAKVLLETCFSILSQLKGHLGMRSTAMPLIIKLMHMRQSSTESTVITVAAAEAAASVSSWNLTEAVL